MAGFTDGYSTKLLAHSEYSTTGGRRTKRHFSPESFDAYLQALGLDLLGCENTIGFLALKPSWNPSFYSARDRYEPSLRDCLINLKVSRDFMRRIGKNGGIASGRKRHARAERREVARRAALARWSKAR